MASSATGVCALSKSLAYPNRARVRVVDGSCWSCKKRRVKCDLTKPSCERCSQIGAPCNYNERLIRWSRKPSSTVPATYQVSPHYDLLAAYEKSALDYFQGRFWPLLTTAHEPCALPTSLVLGQRVLFLATCLVANTHRVLQDGRNNKATPQLRRLECLAAVRGQVDQYCATGKGPLVELLLAVMLLYFHDGYLGCIDVSPSTTSHYAGVIAIIERLGGGDVVLQTGPDCLHLLISEFASTDLTTATLRGRRPYFATEIWDKIDRRSVWWSRDPFDRSSLSGVFKQISEMVHYRDSIQSGHETLQDCRVKEFETRLTPSYAHFHNRNSSSLDANTNATTSREAVNVFAQIRSFQHAGLIYCYRVLCGLPTTHPLVQQHVSACLECIFGVERPSRVLNCMIFPLLVAGAHVQWPWYQRSVANMIHSIYNEVKFKSFQTVRCALESLWENGPEELTWLEMFAGLEVGTTVL